VVCRARGARQPLFRRSQFHAGAALTARKALDASALARAARTSGRTVAATNKCLAQSNKPRTRGKATKKRESRLLRRCDPSSENETQAKEIISRGALSFATKQTQKGIDREIRFIRHLFGGLQETP
jgi:hypothetical protein